MAIGTEEKKLLNQFWEKNKELLLATLHALIDDPDSAMSQKERDEAQEVVATMERARRKFRFNGQSGLSMNRIVLESVKKWIADHPQATYNEIKEVFKLDNFSSGVIQPTDWEKFKSTDYGKHSFFPDELELGDHKKIRVCSNWGSREFTRFLEETLKERLNYMIECED